MVNESRLLSGTVYSLTAALLHRSSLSFTTLVQHNNHPLPPTQTSVASTPFNHNHHEGLICSSLRRRGCCERADRERFRCPGVRCELHCFAVVMSSMRLLLTAERLLPRRHQQLHLRPNRLLLPVRCRAAEDPRHHAQVLMHKHLHHERALP